MTICRGYKKKRDMYDVIKQRLEGLKRRNSRVKDALREVLKYEEVEEVDGVPQYEKIPDVAFTAEDLAGEEPMETDIAEQDLGQLRVQLALQFKGRLGRRIARLKQELEDVRAEKVRDDAAEKESRRELEATWKGRMVEIQKTQPKGGTVQLVQHTVTRDYLLTYLVYREYYPALTVTSTRWMARNIERTPGEVSEEVVNVV